MNDNHWEDPPQNISEFRDWSDVWPNDTILVHENNIHNVTENPIEEMQILRFTTNKFFAQILRGKGMEWIQTKNYTVKEILPPVVKETEQ